MLCILLSILWRWIMPRRSSVTVTREVTRSMGRHRYRKEQKQYHFSVAPAFTDSLPRHKYEEREVKAWGYSGEA